MYFLMLAVSYAVTRWDVFDQDLQALASFYHASVKPKMRSAASFASSATAVLCKRVKSHLVKHNTADPSKPRVAGPPRSSHSYHMHKFAHHHANVQQAVPHSQSVSEAHAQAQAQSQAHAHSFKFTNEHPDTTQSSDDAKAEASDSDSEISASSASSSRRSSDAASSVSGASDAEI